MATVLVLVFALAWAEPQQDSARTACDPPDLVGLTQQAAVRLLAAHQMRLGTVNEAPSTVPAGTIIGQRPKACSDARRATPVNIVVSAGRASEPERSGGSSVGRVALPIAAAAVIAAVIAARRDRPERVETPVDEPPPPAPNRAPDRTATVPAVEGLSWAEAQRVISAAQLRAIATNPADAANLQAVVSAQVPSAGTAVVPGATVGVTMALPPPPPLQDPVAPVPIAPPVLTQPVETPAVVPPRLPMPVDGPVPVPRAPVQPTSSVLPSRSFALGIPSVAPAVIALQASVYGVTAGGDRAQWPWIVLVAIGVIVALMALVRWFRRRRVASGPKEPAVPPAVTFVSRPDRGIQEITDGARSRTIDIVVRLDSGTQVFRPHVRLRPMGATS